MTPEAADWVYDVVLTQTYKQGAGCDDRGPAAIRVCPCQWGPCGWCKAGRPDRCAHRDGRARKDRDPEGWLGGIEYRRAGRGCRWHCPGPDLRDAVQPELFAVGGAR